SPLAHVEVAQLDRAVEEVVEVRRGERVWRIARDELRGDLPVRALGRVELDGDRPVLEAARPDEGGRDVQVRVRRVDPAVGAVGAVGEEGVGEAHGAVVPGDDPAVWVGLGDLERTAAGVRGLDGVDVLRELVDRVAAGGGPAHTDLEGAGGEVGEGDKNACLVVHGIGERNLV